jgi:Tfp pilus assembly protein PilF
MRALSRFESGDFHGAQQWAEKAVTRAPESLLAGVLLSACETSRGEYEPARARLTPALARAPSKAPYIRAAIHNNLAFALLMTSEQIEAI